MKQILIDARKNGYAVGAFEFWSLDSARAVVKAAQELRVPVILQIGEFEVAHMDGYKNSAAIVQMAADLVDIPVALHLDHGETLEQVREAIDAGFTSVMIDSSHCSYEKNVEVTQKVVEMARPYNISVEAELGVLAGSEGKKSKSEEEASQTSPEEAGRFIADTGVDVLAVAIGTAHGFYNYEPHLNLERLEQIAKVVSEPLVLHGGSGTPDEAVQKAITKGIAKINICTEFIAAFSAGLTNAPSAPGFKYNVPNFFGMGYKSGYALAHKKIELFLNNKKAVLF
jgi:ketose-bisphosphate aldolase